MTQNKTKLHRWHIMELVIFVSSILFGLVCLYAVVQSLLLSSKKHLHSIICKLDIHNDAAAPKNSIKQQSSHRTHSYDDIIIIIYVEQWPPMIATITAKPQSGWVDAAFSLVQTTREKDGRIMIMILNGI